MESHQPHVLVVDDDREIRDLVSRYLSQHGLRASVAKDGQEMMQALEAARIDLVVLDLMMPGEDGLSLCKRLRGQSTVPVIMLTAMREDIDRIVGLEVGADDYLGKPFNPRELLARIKAVLRRSGAPAGDPEEAAILVFERWQLDIGARTLTEIGGAEIPRTSGEFDLLRVLVERPQRTLSRDQLLDLTRGRVAGPFDRSIDVMVSRLRRKLDDEPASPRLIKTVRTGGYQWAVPVERR